MMTKKIILISLLLCLVLLSSCVKNHEEPRVLPDTGDVKESIAESNEADTSSVESIPNETLPQETTTIETTPEQEDDEPIGGSHLGDELYSPYSGYVDTIIYKKGTFSEHYAQYIEEFVEMEGKWENDRPAVMYHLAQAMGLTRNDLEIYYAALGYENVPESIYAGLLADTLEESMQLLKTDYAFYHAGKLYTAYDIYNMQQSKSLTFDINDPVYDEVWESIHEYISSYPSIYDTRIMQFVEENLQQIN